MHECPWSSFNEKFQNKSKTFDIRESNDIYENHAGDSLTRSEFLDLFGAEL